jgi:site-specific recombinase XerC
VHRRGLSGKSIQRLLSSIRSLYRFLMKRHRVAHNPAQGVSAPKSSRKLPEVLNPDDLDHLQQWLANEPEELADLLTPRERGALVHRVSTLRATAKFPEPVPGLPALPWPAF